MLMRLLLVLWLLLLSQVSFGQTQSIKKPGVPETCRVTKASDQPFVPPSPYPNKPSSSGFWFGTDRLWTALPVNGEWTGFRQKMSWWRHGYDWRAEPKPKLTVTGRRLDFPAPPLAVDQASSVNVTGTRPAYMMVGINFPTVGCWEISGHYEDDELTVVVYLTQARSVSTSPRWTEADRKSLLARARHGEAGAQFWLGAGYEQGWFGKANFQEALRWLRKAAAHGDADAQNVLGQMYEDGEGVQQDYVLAAEWYRKAAEHVPDLGGAGQGRNNLGVLYLHGLGVPKDYVQAYMWFSLTGSEANLSYAKAQMTHAQLLDAKRMATEWKSNRSER
jgi:Sel1 repeat